MLAVLVEGFWRGQTELAGEIRLQSGLFGLDPVSRRKLGWSVTRESQERRPSPPTPGGRRDPRNLLEMVRPPRDPLRSLRDPEAQS